MRTLVIHPSDRTTDFLEGIYSKLDALVIRGEVTQRFLADQITEADRVYMLGHGTPQGLLGHQRIMLDRWFVPALRAGDKQLVGVWCNADVFFKEHNLTGLYTGMIISEPNEARIFNVNATQSQITASNRRLSEALREALETWEPRYAGEAAATLYGTHWVWSGNLVNDTYGYDYRDQASKYNVSNPVVEYNVKNIYSTSRPEDKDRPLTFDTECPTCGSPNRRVKYVLGETGFCPDDWHVPSIGKAVLDLRAERALLGGE